jgi:poly(A) polymerase
VLLRTLQDCNADIIGLQEVEPSFLRQLLAEPWIRSHYYVSDTESAVTVSPDGQVLLSRYPFITRIHAYSKAKRVIVGDFRVNGRRLLVPVVHLTSDHQDNAMQKRIKQMNVLYDYAVPTTANTAMNDCVMIGDFNFGDGEDGEEYALRNDFLDSWKVLHPGDDGFTFDPATNPLAKINTPSGASRRLDRVLISSPAWKPTRIERIGTTVCIPLTHHICTSFLLYLWYV